MNQLAFMDKGLVLLTGPTGSGKSTTLAAMINHINEYIVYIWLGLHNIILWIMINSIGFELGLESCRV